MKESDEESRESKEDKEQGRTKQADGPREEERIGREPGRRPEGGRNLSEAEQHERGTSSASVQDQLGTIWGVSVQGGMKPAQRECGGMRVGGVNLVE